MQVVDLFSGIGGFSLAAHWLGWDTVQMVEINPFCQKILKYHFPNAKLHDDVKTFGLEVLKKSRWDSRKDTILCGGFPCQPYSVAGKRKGKEDNRHLWPEMLRAIREIQPAWVVGENVRGITNWNGGMVFNEVQADLEALGYEVTPFILPACAVNAPHRRDRVWFIAYSDNNARWGYESGRIEEKEFILGGASRLGTEWTSTDSYGFGNNTAKKTSRSLRQQQSEKQQWSGGTMQTNGFSDEWTTSNSNNELIQRGQENRNIGKIGQKRNKQFKRLHHSANWQNFPTQSPICDGDDGLSSRLDAVTFPKWRNESIKGGGNAIVPIVALQIFKTVNQYLKLNKL